MKYGYTIVYVSSVPKTLEFYRDAFGFAVKFIHESKTYGELDTGGTTLAFASHELGEMNLGGKYLKGDLHGELFGIELGFITEDVAAAMKKAIAHGALLIKTAETKPWGQTVGYVRAIDGSLIELCTPVSS
ncbi:MAG: VOC family protein [Cyanobacteria bacterium J06629_2]